MRYKTEAIKIRPRHLEGLKEIRKEMTEKINSRYGCTYQQWKCSKCGKLKITSQ